MASWWEIPGILAVSCREIDFADLGIVQYFTAEEKRCASGTYVIAAGLHSNPRPLTNEAAIE
jgi:hypothetical protein